MSRPICARNDYSGEQCRKKAVKNGKYCSPECRRRVIYLKKLQADKKVNKKGSHESKSRGAKYPDFVQYYAADIENKKKTHQQVADLLEIDRSQITRMYAAYLEDKENFEAQQDWEVNEETIKALEDFKDFRNRYFKTETGDLYETADFHENWINNIVDAIENGKQQMILSPPRHGKTDLLTHFAVWQICKNPNIRIMWVGGNECKNPNIRIMWVGGNEDIAKNAVGAVMDHLENNEQLNEEINGPGVKFQPKVRSGKSWLLLAQEQLQVLSHLLWLL
jgi:hypothetical protein